MVEDVLLCLGKYWIWCHLKESVAPDGEVLGKCREEWVGSGFGCQGSVFEDDALGRCCGGERFEDLATDGIEDDACAFTRGDLVDAGHQVFLPGNDHMIRPGSEELGSLG